MLSSSPAPASGERGHGGVVAVVVLAAAVVLAGCGWQLRGGGQAALAGETLRVEPRMGEGALARATTRSLRRLGAGVVDAGGTRVVELLGERTSRRVTAVDDRGRPTAYELSYRIEFAVNDGEDERLIAPRVVTTRGSYDAAPLDTLAEQAQRERLTEELRDEAVRLMLSRVARAGGGD